MAQTPIHGEQGGARLTIGDGGTLVIDGGAVSVTGATAIADVVEDASATYDQTELEAALGAINDILAFLRLIGLPAS